MPEAPLLSVEGGTLSRVAKTLGLRLPVEAGAILAKGNTRVPGAFDFYLQARGHQTHPDRAEEVELAISFLKQAISKDGSYGLAYAGLGESYWAKRAVTKDELWTEKARESLLRAVGLKRRSCGRAYTTGKNL